MAGTVQGVHRSHQEEVCGTSSDELRQDSGAETHLVRPKKEPQLNMKKSRAEIQTENRTTVTAYTLKEIAEMDGVTTRTAQNRKDSYAAVVFPYGKPDKDGNRKKRVRYLDKETTEKLR